MLLRDFFAKRFSFHQEVATELGIGQPPGWKALAATLADHASLSNAITTRLVQSIVANHPTGPAQAEAFLMECQKGTGSSVELFLASLRTCGFGLLASKMESLLTASQPTQRIVVRRSAWWAVLRARRRRRRRNKNDDDDSEDSEDDLPEENQSFRPYVCQFCANSFTSLAELRDHCDEKVHWRCSVCLGRFDQQSSLEHHQKWHKHEVFSCNSCRGSFKTKEELDKHRLEMKHWTCMVCKRPYTSASTLRQHILAARHFDLENSGPSEADEEQPEEIDLADNVKLIARVLAPISIDPNYSIQDLLRLGDASLKSSPPNYEAAKNYFLKAARFDSPIAQRQLGYCFGYGWWPERWQTDSHETKQLNEATARAWFRLAALQGDAEAQFRYSRYLRNDEEESVRFLSLAASQGHLESQYELGQTYIWQWHGQDFDYCRAIFWLRKAADAGHERARQELSWWYHVSFGVPRDIEELRSWNRARLDKEEKARTATVV